MTKEELLAAAIKAAGGHDRWSRISVRERSVYLTAVAADRNPPVAVLTAARQHVSESGIA